MPGGTCRTPECENLVADAWVCSTCAHRLDVALADAPDLLAELDVDLTRQGRTGQRVGGRSTERPLPYDPGASLIRDALASTLRTWCLIIDGDLLGQAPADDRLAEHLADRIERVRHHTEGGTCVDEVCAAVTAAREHLLAADRDPSMLAGHCPDCHTPVYAREGAATAPCRRDGCDGMVDVAAWRQGARDSLRTAVLPLADTHQALTALGHPVPLGTLKSWVRRGRLRPCWATDDQRALYLVADAITLTKPTTKTPTATGA
jgi:hypothetical protein